MDKTKAVVCRFPGFGMDVDIVVFLKLVADTFDFNPHIQKGLLKHRA
jgi:hypothetical protein